MRLDSQLAELLRQFGETAAPPLYTLCPSDARAAYLQGVQSLSAPAPDIARTDNTAIDTGEGSVRVHLYYPRCEQQRRLPLVVYFHGGGWSFGGIETHDNVCRLLCARTASIVASVEYRLSPEYKFPRAVEDAIAASAWARENGEALGADPERIVLAGDSAGANLAAVAAIAARDRGEHDIYCQLLIYPATDLTMSQRSHTRFGDEFRLTRPLMVWSAAQLPARRRRHHGPEGVAAVRRGSLRAAVRDRHYRGLRSLAGRR